jgi:hypothetical protein
MPLSDDIIDNTETRTKPFKFFDGRGLYLLINPNGSKYWRLKFRFVGKEKSISLGVYPEVSLAVARTRREEARGLLRAGINPSEARKSEKETHKSEKETRKAQNTREKTKAKYTARIADELRSLRVSILRDRIIEIRMGRASLRLTEQGTRHLEHLLSRLPKRKAYADATH